MDPETDPKRQENTEDMDTSKNDHNYSPIHESSNQFLSNNYTCIIIISLGFIITDGCSV